jgi:hypothetical protein
MLIYLPYFLHFIASIVTAHSVWQLSRRYEIPITIHNLPIILMCGVILALCATICVVYTHIYLAVGIMVGIFSWISNSIKIENVQQVTVGNKIIAFIVNLYCFPQVLMITAFYLHLCKVGKIKHADLFKS